MNGWLLQLLLPHVSLRRKTDLGYRWPCHPTQRVSHSLSLFLHGMEPTLRTCRCSSRYKTFALNVLMHYYYCNPLMDHFFICCLKLRFALLQRYELQTTGVSMFFFFFSSLFSDSYLCRYLYRYIYLTTTGLTTHSLCMGSNL